MNKPTPEPEEVGERCHSQLVGLLSRPLSHTIRCKWHPVDRPGRADLADHLSAAHPLTRLNQIARGVVESGLHPNSIDAAVAEDQSISIGGTEEGSRHHSGVGRPNRCAAGGGKVSAVVQFPDPEQRMEPHSERGTHNTCDRVEKPVTARPSRYGHDRAGLHRGRGRECASPSFTLHDLTLRLGHQSQPATATREQEQRVEIALALPQSPVQAAATMPAPSEDADHLSQRHPITGAERGDHGLICGADRAVIDADDGPASNRPGEHHRAARRRNDGLTRFGDKINTAVPGGPGERGWSETLLHHGRPVERPAGRCRQPKGGCGRSRIGEHSQADRDEDRHLKVSTDDLHGGSLWTPAGIVRSLANLWTTVGGTSALWID